MIRVWQVVLTYVWRPRFWVLGIFYLVASTWWAENMRWGAALVGGLLPTITLASVTCCFIALHLRRQFGNAEARLTPGFAVPHFVVGAVVSLLVWVVVPWGQAWLADAQPWALIAAYSVAGLSLAVTVCWPKAMVLVMAMPLGIAWDVLHHADSFSSRFLKGEVPLLSAAMVALAVLAHPLAAIFLLRLSDHVFVNDDFLVERPRSEGVFGRWENLLLSFRDARVERRLARVGRGWWAIGRWRIPVALAWSTLALVVACVLGLMGLAWYGTGNREYVIPVVLMASVMFLLAPFGPWQLRRQWLSIEMMRPVTRPRFFRELALALAADVVLWTSLISVIVIGTAGLLSDHRPPVSGIGRVGMIVVTSLVYLALLWGMACFLYGIALVTLRFRYWIPLIFTLGIAWCIAFVVAAVNMQPTPREVNVLVFPATSALLGLLLTWIAYRRWLETDLT